MGESFVCGAESAEGADTMGNRLYGRQLAIMRVLWKQGDATVAEVQSELEVERPLAYSTVATVLARMERKGLVAHRAEGRTFVYRAAVSEDGVGSSMLGELIETVFGGSSTQLVSHLLESREVDSRELGEIKKLVEQHEKKRHNPRKG